MPQPTPSNLATARNWIVIGAVLIGGLVYLAYQRKQAAPAAAVAAAANANGAASGILATGDINGVTAPDWTLKDVNGNAISLDQFKGRPVVLDFWATWCGPCQIELPWWKEFQDKYKAQGLQIIGISEDNSINDVKQYLVKNPLNYMIVWDSSTGLPGYGAPFGMPTTLFVNRDGKITHRSIGLEGKPELEKAIQGIL